MSEPKLPALQFYTGDWRKDPCVQSLDHEHKGVWIDLLCIMNETSERGRLVLPGGSAMPDDAIARNLGIDLAKWKQIRSTLLVLGVASQDGDGVLYNRRIVRDEAIRRSRREAGRQGGRTKRTRSKPRSKSEAEGGSSVSSSSSASTTSSDSDAPFDEAWVVCRRGSKRKALHEYRKAVPSKVSHAVLLAAWRAHVSAASDERYVAHLFRWIRDERWEESPVRNGTPTRPATFPLGEGSAARFVR